MKKLMIIIMLPYLLVLAFVAYLFYGVGTLESYQALEWQGLSTEAPAGFDVKTYQSQGWTVYYMKKAGSSIRLGLKPAFNVNTLPRYSKKVKFEFSPGPDRVFYIATAHKAFQVIFAQTIGDTSVYFQVSSPSPFTGRAVLRKITRRAQYKGSPVSLPEPDVPLGVFITDFILMGGMLLPVFIIYFVLYYSGKKPSPHHFEGDPIRCEEEYVFFSGGKKFRRKNSYCYLVLTTNRLMVFVFKKLNWEVRMDSDDPDTRIDIDGKKIIIHLKDQKVALKPKDIGKWKECLISYM
jgi:hypothetical protein